MSPVRKLFGTDGIRGVANRYPVTPEIALNVGMAAGLYFNRGGHRHRVVIAKDTRLSGYMIEPALTAGFVATGMDVILVGPLPTPAVAMLTRSMRADLGVMISASHNPYQDNGIKLFGPDGFKLSDQSEVEIEALMEQNLESRLARNDQLGRAERLDNARGRYIEYIKNTFPRGMTLDGMKIVIDCANGAAYNVGPLVLRELGAEVIPIGTTPDGFNINRECGSTHPELLCKTVHTEKATLGIALDGDADRVVMCDENGNVIDGDQLMAMIAGYWYRHGTLKGGAIVATQMSNMGMEQYLQTLGLNLHRTNVGDRYVVQAMREHGINIGGEQSGHLILSDYSTTGDGLLAALQVLAVLRESGSSMSQTGQVFTPMPQLLKNFRYGNTNPMDAPTVKQAIQDAESTLRGHGRVFIRKSGTEPLIRIMAEGENADEVEQLVDSIYNAMQQAGGK